MLSIRFIDDEHEWWVSSHVINRLFQSALDAGHITQHLHEWRYIAAANGGFGLKNEAPDVVHALTSGLRAAASAEVTRFEEARPDTEDGGYVVSLKKLLTVTRDL